MVLHIISGPPEHDFDSIVLGYDGDKTIALRRKNGEARLLIGRFLSDDRPDVRAHDAAAGAAEAAEEAVAAEDAYDAEAAPARQDQSAYADSTPAQSAPSELPALPFPATDQQP